MGVAAGGAAGLWVGGYAAAGRGGRGSVYAIYSFNLPRSGGWNGLVVDYGAVGGVRVVKFVLRSLVVVILIEVLEEANQVAGLAHLVGQDFGVGFDFAGFGDDAGPGAGGQPVHGLSGQGVAQGFGGVFGAAGERSPGCFHLVTHLFRHFDQVWQVFFGEAVLQRVVSEVVEVFLCVGGLGADAEALSGRGLSGRGLSERGLSERGFGGIFGIRGIKAGIGGGGRGVSPGAAANTGGRGWWQGFLVNALLRLVEERRGGWRRMMALACGGARGGRGAGGPPTDGKALG